MAEPPKTQILQFMQYFICYVCALAFLGCTTFTAHIVRLFEGIHQASPEGTNRTLSVSKSSPRKEMKKFAEGFGWGGVSSANETRCNNYLIVWKEKWSLFLKPIRSGGNLGGFNQAPFLHHYLFIEESDTRLSK